MKTIEQLEKENAELAAQVEALEFNISEYNRLHNELNAILHPDGDGPAAPSLCDLVSYVKTDLQALYAQLDSVKSLFPIDCLIGCGGLLNYPVEKYNKVVAALNATPQHHLREVRVATVFEFVELMPQFAYGVNEKIQKYANQYADSIRKGEVE